MEAAGNKLKTLQSTLRTSRTPKPVTPTRGEEKSYDFAALRSDATVKGGGVRLTVDEVIKEDKYEYESDEDDFEVYDMGRCLSRADFARFK